MKTRYIISSCDLSHNNWTNKLYEIDEKLFISILKAKVYESMNNNQESFNVLFTNTLKTIENSSSFIGIEGIAFQII